MESAKTRVQRIIFLEAPLVDGPAENIPQTHYSSQSQDWGEQWTATFVPTPCTFSRSLQLGASYLNLVFEKMDRKTWSLGFGFGSLQHWNLGFSTPHVAIPRGMSTHPCQKLAKVVQAGSKISSFLGVHAKSWLPRRMDSTPTVGKDEPLGYISAGQRQASRWPTFAGWPKACQP